MSNTSSQLPQPQDELGELPRELRTALRGLYPGAPEVPERMDRFILSAARAGLGRRRRNTRMARWASAGIAAAAMIMLSIHLTHPFSPSRPGLTPVAMVGDVNHDGRIDILDAYRIARALADHRPLDPSWDVNGDGVVDQKDVDWVANLAVSTSAGGTGR